eukprot:gene24370-biopygen14946
MSSVCGAWLWMAVDTGKQDYPRPLAHPERNPAGAHPTKVPAPTPRRAAQTDPVATTRACGQQCCLVPAARSFGARSLVPAARDARTLQIQGG